MDFLFEPFKLMNDGDLVMGIILLILYLFFLGFVLWGLYIAIDSWVRPIYKGKGKVINKEFIPAHIQIILIYNAATKTSIPHLINHPDNWVLHIKFEEQTDSISVKEEFYNTLSINDDIDIKYKKGRLSGGLYITSVSLGLYVYKIILIGLL